jgi:hypothetical protein
MALLIGAWADAQQPTTNNIRARSAMVGLRPQRRDVRALPRVHARAGDLAVSSKPSAS